MLPGPLPLLLQQPQVPLQLSQALLQALLQVWTQALMMQLHLAEQSLQGPHLRWAVLPARQA